MYQSDGCGCEVAGRRMLCQRCKQVWGVDMTANWTLDGIKATCFVAHMQVTREGRGRVPQS
jgi:hypothetical protein